MQESVVGPAKRFVGFWRKTGIVFLMALVAAGCYYFLFENPGWPQDSSGWSVASARILGAAFVYFLVAMIFAAWIKGVAGVVVGGLIVALECYFACVGADHHRRPERELISSLQKDQQAIKDSFKEHINDFGGGTVDPKKFDSLLADLNDKSKDLDPQDKAATEALAAVMDPLIEVVRKARPLSDEMFSQQFQDIGSIRTVVEIDARLGKIEAFRKLSGELLSMYQNVDVTLKMELARRNLSATYINGVTNSFVKSSHMEISLPMAEANIELADIMSRRFTLLKKELGHWQVRNQVVYFAHSKAIEQWNNDVREYFQVAEKREKLTRQLAAIQGN
jgi:hypothetical protein